MGSPGGPVGLPGEVLANGLEGVRPEAFRKTYSDPGGLIGMVRHCTRMGWSVGAVCTIVTGHIWPGGWLQNQRPSFWVIFDRQLTRTIASTV